MKRFFIIFGLIFILLLIPVLSFSAEKSWEFLPSRTLFSPLIADPREPQTAFVFLVDEGQLAGAVGRSFDLFQWKLSRRRGNLSWGLTGAAFALLDYGGGSFPMLANDWQFGTYLSHSKKKFSQRLEFTHISAHLGDSLSDERNRFVYSREFMRWILSYEQNDFLRFYGGGGFSVHTIPDEDTLFFQGGTEFFSPSIDFLSDLLRLYVAYDLKYKKEAGGVFNNSLQFGIQLLPHNKKTRNAIRLGISYFNGNDEFGQFFREKETHWGFGIYFDS